MSTSTKSLARVVVIVLGLFALACGGDFCKDATSTVVETTVKGSKQVTKGIVEGVQEGRKAGESVDGATIVTAFDELKGTGSLEVYAIKPAAVDSSSTIEIAVQNTTDRPMRVSGMQYTVLDGEGFAKKPTRTHAEITVAPKSKDKITLEVPIAAADIKTVRLWDTDLDVRDGALQEAAPSSTPDAGSD